jgi:hypothetical protein
MLMVLWNSQHASTSSSSASIEPPAPTQDRGQVTPARELQDIQAPSIVRTPDAALDTIPPLDEVVDGCRTFISSYYPLGDFLSIC